MKLPIQAFESLHLHEPWAATNGMLLTNVAFSYSVLDSLYSWQIDSEWKVVLLILDSWRTCKCCIAVKAFPPRHLEVTLFNNQATDSQDIPTCPRMAEMAATSMGSPSGVPLACICKALMAAGATRPLRSAATIRLCWEGPCGAVSALDLPFVLTAVPTTSAKGAPLVSEPLTGGGDLDLCRLGVATPFCAVGDAPCFGGKPLGNEVLLASGDGWAMGGLDDVAEWVASGL